MNVALLLLIALVMSFQRPGFGFDCPAMNGDSTLGHTHLPNDGHKTDELIFAKLAGLKVADPRAAVKAVFETSLDLRADESIVTVGAFQIADDTEAIGKAGDIVWLVRKVRRISISVLPTFSAECWVNARTGKVLRLFGK